MTYTYRASGLARYYNRYVEALLNKFTESGLQIVNRSINPAKCEIKVRYGDEVGSVKVEPYGDDIIVSFDVRKTLERRGLEIAHTGFRFFETLVTGGSPVDATLYTIEDSFNAALSGNRGYLASVIANAVRDAAEDLKYKIEEEFRTREEKEKKIEELMASVKSRLLTLGEEIILAKDEGKDVSKIERRYRRARQLYEEAVMDANAGYYVDASAKLEAASKLLDRAEELLENIYE